jgi:ribosomal protein S18 acetylase RimI-like enzyme
MSHHSPDRSRPRWHITQVIVEDLTDLLPLMRAYCDFYRVSPTDSDLLKMSRALIDDPKRDGIQLIARQGDGQTVGFTTMFWSWSTLSAARIAVMNDLYVHPDARGTGLADALIDACAKACIEREDIVVLCWQTAKDNARAQAVYDRVGATRQEWLDYSIDPRTR